MKTIFNNIFHILRRFKTATILNIIGLSTAFAAFTIIMMQVDYDYNYDKFHNDAEQIYRMEITRDDSRSAVSPRPMYDYITTLPQVKEGTLGEASNYDFYFSISETTPENSFVEKMMMVEPGFIDFFDFRMISGNQDALTDNRTVVIPESLAKKIFGNSDPVGQRLYNRDINEFVKSDYYVVGGVYKDFPKNSTIGNLFYASMGDFMKGDWYSSMFYSYLKVQAPEDVAVIEKNYKDYMARSEFSDYMKNADIELSPFTEIHFDSAVLYDATPKASSDTLFILMLIAFTIIIIAAVNYTNFSIALIPIRIKSINIRKVLGASDSSLRIMGILESVFMCLIAYLLSIIIVNIILQTPLATLIDADTSLMSSPLILVITLAIALIVGIISGIYPSFQITSFQPALVLKGSFGLSPKGKKMRSILISIQFIAAFVLIISSAFMYLQNRYMHNSNFGYDKERLIVADLNMNIAHRRDIITDQLKQFPDIEGISYSSVLLSSSDQYAGWGRGYEGKLIDFQVLMVDPSFIEVMGIKIDEGRDFRESDSDVVEGKYIFNEKAKQEFGLELNHFVNASEIIGFIPDIQFTTFRASATPTALHVQGKQNTADHRHLYVRVKEGSNMIEALKNVEAALTKIEPGWTFDVRFYNDVLNKAYEKDTKLSMLITLFSIIAIVISIIGVFGLVIFENEYRRKEIGIRKVFGSSVKQVLGLLSKTYLIILTICFVIACPIVYYVINKWLENFTVRTPIYIWVFLLGGIIVFIITLITVNWQSWKAATANPVDSFKNE